VQPYGAWHVVRDSGGGIARPANEENTMNEQTLPVTPVRTSRDRLLIGVVAGGLVIASLGAAAGWLLRGTPAAVEPVAVAEVAPPVVPPKAPAAPRKSTPVTSSPAVAEERAPLVTQPAAVCDSCGTVEGVRSYERKGEGSGLGAVAGGVLGGVIGNQIGGGNGRKAMTVIGAVGGGVAGHEVEKRVKSETVYEVRVRMDDGSLRTLTQKTAPAPGARVVVDGSTLRSVSAADTAPRTLQTSAKGA